MDIIDTLHLKKEIKCFYGIDSVSSINDNQIVDFLCIASNTAEIVSCAFQRCKENNSSLYDFYKEVVSQCITRDLYPMFCDLIVSTITGQFDHAVTCAIPTERVKHIWNGEESTPYLDVGITKIPFKSDKPWGKEVHFAWFKNSEYSYVLEQLLSKLDNVQYEFQGKVKLKLGNETRTILSQGLYTIYFGKNWVIVEVNGD